MTDPARAADAWANPRTVRRFDPASRARCPLCRRPLDLYAYTLPAFALRPITEALPAGSLQICKPCGVILRPIFSAPPAGTEGMPAGAQINEGR